MLIRDDKERKSLGELLIEKANNGVNVNLLVWKETGKYNLIIGSSIQSNLETGDDIALNYFKKSKVKIKLNRRYGYSGLLFS
jgi:hypothetical protein